MVKVLLSSSFLQNIADQGRRNILDFEQGPFDLDSYLFFRNLLKRSEIYINLKEHEIADCKNPKIDLSRINPELQKIALCLKSLTQVKVESGLDLYNQLRNRDYSFLKEQSLPNFLLLEACDKQMCQLIEAETGVICFSTRYNNVPEHLKRVQLKKIKNTKNAFFSELEVHPFNQISIEDPQLINRLESKKDIDFVTANLFLERAKKFRAGSINFELRYKNEKKEWITLVETSLKRYHNVRSFFKNDAKHDRYVVTNNYIMIIGNSLNQASETHLTIFPKWLYSSFFT